MDLQCAVRESVQEFIGFHPFELLFGRGHTDSKLFYRYLQTTLEGYCKTLAYKNLKLALRLIINHEWNSKKACKMTF